MATIIFEFRVLCLIAMIPLGSLDFVCPGAIYPPQGLSYGYIEPNISGRASKEYAKMRIKLVHDQSIEGKPYKRLVQNAADFWSNALSVKPVNGRLFKSQDCKSEKDIYYKASNESTANEKYCLGSCANVTKYSDIEVPKEHLDGCMSCNEEGKNCSKNDAGKGTGIENADLVFYVTAIQNEFCQSSQLLAYAEFCDQEPSLDRPLFALINICPEPAEIFTNDKMLRAIKHEMLHALGFGFFKLFRDKHGKPLWPREENGEPKKDDDVKEQTVLKTIERDWHVRGGIIKSNRTFLTTPKVVEEVRAHFNCQDLEGAELEDFGGNETQHGHFETRVFNDDGMNGNVNSGKMFFSRLDFAVLEDSGWYQVNYSQAEAMDFGRNLGCDFCMKSCKFWMDSKRKEGQSIKPYCDKPDLIFGRGFSCIGTKKLFSGCPLTKIENVFLAMLQDPNSLEPFDELPKKYQNFDKISDLNDSIVPQCGSINPLADFCPIPVLNLNMSLISNAECKMQNDDAEKASNESEKHSNVTEKDPNEIDKKPNEDKNNENEDEKHQMNQSSQLGSSVQLVSFLMLIVVVLLRGILKFPYE